MSKTSSLTQEIKEILKPGEYTKDFGRCYIYGQIERTEEEEHTYFIKDDKGNKQFISKECWIKEIEKETEKQPIKR